MSDHGSTALAVTYIGFRIKIPTNLGLAHRCGPEQLIPEIVTSVKLVYDTTHEASLRGLNSWIVPGNNTSIQH